MGATSISWAPSVLPGSLTRSSLSSHNPTQQQQRAGEPGGIVGQVERQRRVVTGGCDSKVKIWGWRCVLVLSPSADCARELARSLTYASRCFPPRANREETKEWAVEETIERHTDWVRDVAWAPNTGLPASYIASCSQVGCPSPCFLALLSRPSLPLVVLALPARPLLLPCLARALLGRHPTIDSRADSPPFSVPPLRTAPSSSTRAPPPPDPGPPPPSSRPARPSPTRSGASRGRLPGTCSRSAAGRGRSVCGRRGARAGGSA